MVVSVAFEKSTMSKELSNGDLHKTTLDVGGTQNGTKTTTTTTSKYSKVAQSDPKHNKAVTIAGKMDRAHNVRRRKQREPEYDLVPPDGGWGWLVLFGSTLVNILIPGTVKSFGVLFVEFLEVFDATPSAAAWIPALCYFLYSSLGPVSSILSMRFSYRSVTWAGGMSAASGMMLSFFAQSVMYLYISYGIMVGTGAGLAFPPTVYIVTNYFVKRRGLANGICISGSAFGSIILPPILRILLDKYGHRGAVLIMGGLTLNVWVAALFFDPVAKHMRKVPRKTTATIEELDENDVDEEDAEDDDVEREPSVVYHAERKPKFTISNEDNSASAHQLSEHGPFLDSGERYSDVFVRSASSAAVQNYKGAHSHRERKISVPVGHDEMVRVRSGGSRPQLMGSSTLHAVPETSTTHQSPNTQTRRARNAPRRNFSTSSFQYISTPYHGSTLTLQPEIFASTFSLRTNASKRGADADTTTPLSDEKGGETKAASGFSRFFDLALLRDPIYLIILISNSTNAISYTNFIILLPSYAQRLGFDKNKGAILLSVVSAFDLVGRIGGSALSDISKFPKYFYFVTGLFFSGVSLAILPFATDYVTICVCCSCFGLASGVYVGITAVIMTDMLGTERLESCYGISLFVNGILQLIGPPLCGVVFEQVKTYVPMFFVFGLVLIVGSLIWLYMPFVRKEEPAEKDVRNEEEEAEQDGEDLY